MSFYHNIADRIQQAVQIASHTPNNPEKKLRELVAPLWDACIRNKGISLNFEPKDERQFARGRADTVFNRLILEYKKPAAIKSDNKKNWRLIPQVQTYIEDLSKEERWSEERLLGVAFDGKYFLYVRKIGRWIAEEPIPVDANSIEGFILRLEKLTTKAALIPDNLIRDFAIGSGALNYIASNTIKAFYFTLTSNTNERVKVFFAQWAEQFSEVHGAIENKKFDALTLFESYGFNKQEQKNFNFLAFFFALDTYYAILMKLLAYQVVGFYVLKDVVGLQLADWEKLDSNSLKDKLIELEDGGIFRNLGIRNFLEGDLLSWYLNDWNNEICISIKKIINRLNDYDPETMEIVPDQTRDILKKLYQFLVPKVIRHDLGEYYTPDWLAERCLDMVGYGPKVDKLLEKRLLDPGCGSGTFVILGIKRTREHSKLKNISPKETLSSITKNIMGFDLNPLAVISARTNYILAIADLIKHRGKDDITIPIYLCDSINPPSATQTANLFDEDIGFYSIRTSVGNFRFPDSVIKKNLIQEITLLLEDSVKKKLSQDLFLQKLNSILKIEDKKEELRVGEILSETYLKLCLLEEKGINGIWSRIIKNAFAPLFVGQFDFIVGNPPWVNWEDLPQSYRDQTKYLWINYGLFSLGGDEARLGGGKKDISMLMTYVAIDKYLKDNQKLCFVITQTLFKTQGAGDGFRRFKLGQNGKSFKIEYIDDFVELQPFEGATNFTAVFLAKKGLETSYPIPYTLWKKNESMSISIDFNLTEVVSHTTRKNFYAQPINTNLSSPLFTAKHSALKASRKVIGNSYYRGYTGSYSGGANGVYWITIKNANKNLFLIENLGDSGKRKVKIIETEIEDRLIYPLLRGKDMGRWFANPIIFHIIPQNPQTRIGYDVNWMQSNCPLTLQFFNNFKDDLNKRRSKTIRQLMSRGPFYTMFSISENTFAPYKVVWKALATSSQACVVSNFSFFGKDKVIVPEHNTIFVPFTDQNEAHYFCSLINSSVASFIITGYISLFFSSHILENIKIPVYDGANKNHIALSRLSKIAHEKVLAGIQVYDLEEQLDELSAELWDLTKQELKDIKDSLEGLS